MLDFLSEREEKRDDVKRIFKDCLMSIFKEIVEKEDYRDVSDCDLIRHLYW